MRSISLNTILPPYTERIRAFDSIEQMLLALCEQVCSALGPAYMECYYEYRSPEAAVDASGLFLWDSTTGKCSRLAGIQNGKILDVPATREQLQSLSATSRPGPLSLRQVAVPSSQSIVFLNTSTPSAAVWFHIVVNSAEADQAGVAATLEALRQLVDNTDLMLQNNLLKKMRDADEKGLGTRQDFYSQMLTVNREEFDIAHDRVAEAWRTVMKAQSVWIWIHNSLSDVWELHRVSPNSPSLVPSPLPKVPKTAMASWVIKNSEPEYFPSLNETRDNGKYVVAAKKELAGRNYSSFWCIPVTRGSIAGESMSPGAPPSERWHPGELRSVICCHYNADEKPPHWADMSRILKLMAGITAIVLQESYEKRHNRILQRLNCLAEQLSNRTQKPLVVTEGYVKSLLKLVKDEVKCEAVSLFFDDGSGTMVTFRGTTGEMYSADGAPMSAVALKSLKYAAGDGMTGRVFSTGQPEIWRMEKAVSKDYSCRSTEVTSQIHGDLSDFLPGDILDLRSFAKKLSIKADPVSAFLMDRLDKTAQDLLRQFLSSGADQPATEASIMDNLSRIISTAVLYGENRFRDLDPSSAVSSRLNRAVIEDAYPEEICRGRFAYSGIIYPIRRPDFSEQKGDIPKPFGVMRCSKALHCIADEKRPVDFDFFRLKILDFITSQIGPVLETLDAYVSRSQAIRNLKHDLKNPIQQVEAHAREIVDWVERAARRHADLGASVSRLLSQTSNDAETGKVLSEVKRHLEQCAGALIPGQDLKRFDVPTTASDESDGADAAAISPPDAALELKLMNIVFEAKDAQKVRELLESEKNYLDTYLPVRTLLQGAIVGRLNAGFKALGRRKRLRFTIEPFRGSIPPLKIDPTFIARVFQNLLENAEKYSHPGGDVVIRPRMFNAASDDGIYIDIENDGIGVLPEEAELIFKEEYRGRNAIDSGESGDGLGLKMAQKMMEKHGGKITLTRHNQPTIFTLFFPKSLVANV